MKDDARYICDSCGEEIVLPIDLSAGSAQVSSATPSLMDWFRRFFISTPHLGETLACVPPARGHATN